MKRSACLLFLFLSIGITTQSSGQSIWDWHIAGGRVVDGTGTPAFRGDVLIRGDSIGYVGPVDADTIAAERRVDAAGRIVAPGFIDPHAHGDPLETPGFRNFLAMGVTTIVLGQDGSSPGDSSLDTWFGNVENTVPAVNVAALSGHGTIRSAAGAGKRPAEGSVLDRMALFLVRDLRAGSFGLSTGLEYIPGLYSNRAELLRLAAVTGEYDGILMSHLRSEDDSRIEASLGELAALGREVSVHVSHLKVVYGEGEWRAEEILDIIESYRNKGIDFSADSYPYSASYTGIGIVFPEWAKTKAGWRQAMEERPEALKQYLAEKVEQRNGPESLLFGSGRHAGKTLKEVAAERDQTFTQVLMEMGPQSVSAAHFVMDPELQERIVTDPGVMISSDGSPTMRHPRGYGSFAKIIHDYVIGSKELSLEQAVHKMSGLPAETVGIDRRGIIQKGFKADLLLFDPAEVRDTATYGDPHRPADGFDWIWVNGRVARENGVFVEERYGQVLRR